MGRRPGATGGAGLTAHEIESGDLYRRDERRVGAGHSVIGPTGRSHDIANLWICDNSIVPRALAANPALTIMALSLHTVDAFLRR